MVKKFAQYQPSLYIKMLHNSKKNVVTDEVHIFIDASELIRGAITYLNFVFIDGTSTLSFLIGNSQLTPWDCVAPKIYLSKDCL